MFGFVKKVFFVGLTILASFTNANSLYLNEESKSKTRPQVVNVNLDEPLFFPFSIKTSKCSGSCNNINYAYAKICVPTVAKNVDVKVFNLMSRSNETRHIEWHEPCKRVNLGLIFVIINNAGINIIIVSVNVIKRVMLENIETMKIACAEKNWLVN